MPVIWLVHRLAQMQEGRKRAGMQAGFECHDEGILQRTKPTTRGSVLPMQYGLRPGPP